MLGPLNSLVWYLPSLRYTRGLGWRMHCGAEVTESSTNKQHHLSHSSQLRAVGFKLDKVIPPQLEAAARIGMRTRGASLRQLRGMGSGRFVLNVDLDTEITEVPM